MATRTPEQKIRCVVHCRVSSAKQAYEGESLEVQERLCVDFAQSRGWTLAHSPWKESFSGRKAVRPVFQEILEYLDTHPGRARYYLVRSIDRFTRGGSYSYERLKRELLKRGVEIVDTMGVIQPTRNTLQDLGFEYDWSRVSPSEIAEVVVATSANHEVSTILTRLISQEIRLTQRGFKIRRAEDGYINQKIYVEGKRRTIQVPDPERAPYFVEMFRLRIAGHYTDAEICARINAMGYRTKPHHRWDSTHSRIIGQADPKPLIPKRLQEVISRPIYCGVIVEKWTNRQPVRAAYPGLVSISDFNAANRGKVSIDDSGPVLRISNQYGPRGKQILNVNNPLFPFRHVIVCHLCRKPLMGSSPRGRTGQRFPTYHCSRNHRYVGISKEDLEGALFGHVATFKFTRDQIDRFIQACRRAWESRHREVTAAAQRQQSSMRELGGRKKQIGLAYAQATTDLMRGTLEAELTAIQAEIDSLPPMSKEDVSEADLDGFLQDVAQIMETPSLLTKQPVNPQAIRALYAFCYEENPTYENLRDGTTKKRWFLRPDSPVMQYEFTSVRQHGLNWNQMRDTVELWKELKPHLEVALLVPEVPKSTCPRASHFRRTG